MQPAPTLQHRRLARINEFLARQDRIVYILLVVTATVGLTWVVWRHQYLARQEQHRTPEAVARPLPMATPDAGKTPNRR